MIIAMARTRIALSIIISMEYYTKVQTERSHNAKDSIHGGSKMATISDEMRVLSLNNKEDVERVPQRGICSTHEI